MEPASLTRDLVLIGGGHSHALVLRRWGMVPLPGVRLTVIDPAPAAAYSGMLPGFVAGHYPRAALEIDLLRLCRFAGARLILGRATGLDLARRRITVPGRPPVGYDVASLDIGVTSDMPDLPGFAQWGVPAKPLGPFADRWAAWLASPGARRMAVIGGGVAGVELALAAAHALRGRVAEVRLFERARLLAAASAPARARLTGALAQAGVAVVEGAQIAHVAADQIALTDGRAFRSDLTIGAAGARAQDWLAGSGLRLERGFVAVDAQLQSSDPAVFASGDCAEMTASVRPKAGVFAVRQTPVLEANLRAALAGGRRRAYRPQRDYLKLVSMGGKHALAEKWGRAAQGPWLWAWKDRIDRAFMRGLLELPAMPALPPQRVALGAEFGMLCAGCGAKVGRGTLMAALAGLPGQVRPDVTVLPGEDAALIGLGPKWQVITTDHLRAVTPDPVLMTRIAAIHALSDVWAMGAAPQAATLTLILPRQSAALQVRALTEIMATAHEVMAAAGAAIAGGHTTLGAEFTVGFTLTGLLDAAPVTLAGAQPGDALILTKALGVGVILAAEMRGLARGADVVAAWAQMVRPQGDAAQALRAAHAMTDVTGFGLAGHLAGICAASGLAGELDLTAIPLLAGAEALAAQGVRSSLWAQNVAGAGVVTGAAGPRGDLLFDPQTCGGLLAAVPAAQAASVVAALRAQGHVAAIIGRMVPGAPGISCR